MKSLLILIAYAFFASTQPVLRRFEWYQALYGWFPFYVPETIKVGVGLGVCVAAAAWMYGRGNHFAMRGRFGRGIAFGLVASSPMLVGLALTRSVHVADPLALVFLAALFPLAEEVVSRGFAFGLLWRREGWTWWIAAGVVAMVTGIAHVDKSQTAMDVLGLFAVTGLGGFVFSWLFARWQSLWFPFGLHMFMNLWWDTFSVSRTALGGWFALALQIACGIAAIGITLRMTPSLVSSAHRRPQSVQQDSTAGMQLEMIR
jgi:membrane protease YdiL (CAAX protease family)